MANGCIYFKFINLFILIEKKVKYIYIYIFFLILKKTCTDTPMPIYIPTPELLFVETYWEKKANHKSQSQEEDRQRKSVLKDE